jgi:hypothetical protein
MLSLCGKHAHRVDDLLVPTRKKILWRGVKEVIDGIWMCVIDDGHMTSCGATGWVAVDVMWFYEMGGGGSLLPAAFLRWHFFVNGGRRIVRWEVFIILT